MIIEAGQHLKIDEGEDESDDAEDDDNEQEEEGEEGEEGDPSRNGDKGNFCRLEKRKYNSSRRDVKWMEKNAKFIHSALRPGLGCRGEVVPTYYFLPISVPLNELTSLSLNSSILSMFASSFCWLVGLEPICFFSMCLGACALCIYMWRCGSCGCRCGGRHGWANCSFFSVSLPSCEGSGRD